MSDVAKKVPVTPVASQPTEGSPPSVEPSELWRPFQQLRRQIDSLFEDFGRRPMRMPFSHTPFDVEPFWRRDLFTHGMPAMDISELAEEYRISAELPGVDAKDIEIKLVNGNLLIRGEKKEEVDENARNITCPSAITAASNGFSSCPVGSTPRKSTPSSTRACCWCTCPSVPKPSIRKR